MPEWMRADHGTAHWVLTELGHPAGAATADLSELARHVNCAGHTLFLPKGTVGVASLGDGDFAVHL